MKWAAGILVLLVCGVVFKLALLAYAMYVLAGVLWLSRFLARNWMEQITVRRSFSGGVHEIGETAEVTIEIENTGRLAIPWVLIEDSLPREAWMQFPYRLRVAGERLALKRLARGETVTMTYTVTFQARGYYQLGPTLLETGDVFGLHRRFRVAGEPHFAVVLPKVLPLQGYNLASRRPQGEIRVVHRLFEDPTRLAGVRRYQAGDPLNRIHWRATARTGEIHSRLYETSRVAGATFVLDFHTKSFQGGNANVAAELAIVTVASLANAVFELGQQTGFVSNGRDAADRIREEGWRGEFTTRENAHHRAEETLPNDRLRPVQVETRRSADKLREILETLARLEPTDGFDFAEMLATATARIPRDATVVPVLRQVTPETAIALGAMVKSGFTVTAVIVEAGKDALPDWAQLPEWAEQLLAHRIDFRVVNSEESIMELCAQAIAR